MNQFEKQLEELDRFRAEQDYQIGLTRDQLDEVMLELQKKATVEWGWRDTPTGRELFWLYCQFGRILAKACGIEV